ncbi:MAG: hypothetical protein WCG27_06505 [Pseudomonadota bacterium]
MAPKKKHLIFHRANTDKDIQQIYEYSIDAFSDYSPDIKWTPEEIKKDIKDGWQLYSACIGEEVIAALFLREDGDTLLTKNTAIKINYQGEGHSHRIKEFFEERAREMKLAKIVHYCAIDDFRMYSLNESHGYKKTPTRLGENGLLTEWVRNLTDRFTRKKD